MSMERTLRRAAERKAKKAEIKRMKAQGLTPNQIQILLSDKELLAEYHAEMESRTPPAVQTTDPEPSPIPLLQPELLQPEPIQPEPPRSNPAKNALKHGCCAAEHVILPGEDPAEYERIHRNWTNEYEPQSEFEQDILEAAIEAQWNLRRANKNVRKMRAKLYAETLDETEWTDEQHRRLNRFIRYQTRYTNELNQYRRLLEARKRTAEKQAAQDRKAKHKQFVRERNQEIDTLITQYEYEMANVDKLTSHLE